MIIPIGDLGDPRVAPYAGMRDHALRMLRERPGGDLARWFVVEGERVIRRALEAGFSPVSMIRDPRRATAIEEALEPDVPVYTLTPEAASRLAGMHIHRGTMACFERPSEAPPHRVLETAHALLVADRIVNPTNLGVIVRSAVALGFDGLILDHESCDPLYRRASRVAMGASFRLPWARVDPLSDALDTIRGAGFTTIALTPDAAALDIAEAPVVERPALILGNEGTGIGLETQARADVRVRIPMAGDVDSLNVGAAAAIACWAVSRGRTAST